MGIVFRHTVVCPRLVFAIVGSLINLTPDGKILVVGVCISVACSEEHNSVGLGIAVYFNTCVCSFSIRHKREVVVNLGYCPCCAVVVRSHESSVRSITVQAVSARSHETCHASSFGYGVPCLSIVGAYYIATIAYVYVVVLCHNTLVSIGCEIVSEVSLALCPLCSVIGIYKSCIAISTEEQQFSVDSSCLYGLQVLQFGAYRRGMPCERVGLFLMYVHMYGVFLHRKS